MSAATWRLTAAQWDFLTEATGLQERYPSPIEVRRHGRTDVERGRIRERVHAELEAAGALRDARVDPDLHDALRLLQRPAQWIDSVWLPDAAAELPVRVIAARRGGVALCAQQQPDQPGATVVEVIPAGALVAAVIGKLPGCPPGRARTVSTPLDVPPAPEAADGSVLVPVSPPVSSDSTARRAVADILDVAHVRAGQLVAIVRDRAGRVRRSAVLRWCDNDDDGRYQVSVTQARDGRRWLEVAPADPARLGTGVHRLLGSLAPR